MRGQTRRMGAFLGFLGTVQGSVFPEAEEFKCTC